MRLGSGVERLQRLERFLDKGLMAPPPQGSSVHAAEGPRGRRTLAQTYSDLFPSYLPPDHLAGAIEALERAETAPTRIILTLPRRAGKTELVLAYCAHRLCLDPSLRITYATFGIDSVYERSDRCRSLAQRLGVPLSRSSKAKKSWRTGVGQGGFWATSPGGSVVGQGSDLLVLDDILKGRTEADSRQVRDRAHRWLMSDALRTLSPGGSVVVSNTRWHEDDVSGRLIKAGWDEVLVPAVLPGGASYWPGMWSLDSLLATRAELGGELGYDWTSQYMGAPRPSGLAVFRDRTAWKDLQGVRPHMRVVVGIDPAYSQRKSADWSAAVVLGEAFSRVYVLDVVRERLPPESFMARVRKLCDMWSPSHVVAYVARTEENIMYLAREHGVPLSLEFAVSGKDSHANPCSNWWNTGRILTPPDGSGRLWLEPFLSEVLSFTGRGDPHDDQVDAMAAAFLRLVGSRLDWSGVEALSQDPIEPRFDWDPG